VLSAVGGIESSGGILEDTIDFMTGIERVVKCTKEGRCGEGKMRSVVWRRGQTIGSTANGKGRVRSANPAGTQAAPFSPCSRAGTRRIRTNPLPTAPLESQLPY
jgi:hypothetical protein